MKNLLLLAAFISPTVSNAQNAYTYNINRSSSIVIDGDLSEWGAVVSTENLSICNTGQSGKNTVQAKMLWDDNNLYIAYNISDDDITSTAQQQDAFLFQTDDLVEIIFDFDKNGSSYLEMGVNAAGVNYDYDILCTSNSCGGWKDNKTWDIIGLEIAALITGSKNDGVGDQGYTVEIKIPFAGLATMPQGNFSMPVHGTSWKGNLMNVNYNTASIKNNPVEYLSWSTYPNAAIAFHQPDYFGTFVFNNKSSSAENNRVEAFSVQRINENEIQINCTETTILRCIDVLGNVLNEQFLSSNTAYSLAELPAGCYLLQISNGRVASTMKIIK